MNLTLTPTEAAKIYTGAQAVRIFAEHTGDKIAAECYLEDERICSRCEAREIHRHPLVARISGADLVEKIAAYEESREEAERDAAVYRRWGI